MTCAAPPSTNTVTDSVMSVFFCSAMTMVWLPFAMLMSSVLTSPDDVPNEKWKCGVGVVT